MAVFFTGKKIMRAAGGCTPLTPSGSATDSRNVYCATGSVVCPVLPEVAHATSFYVSGSRRGEVANTGVPCADTNVTDGNSCHYECRDGYRLSGSPILVCNSTAQWSGDVPSCIGKFQSYDSVLFRPHRTHGTDAVYT